MYIYIYIYVYIYMYIYIHMYIYIWAMYPYAIMFLDDPYLLVPLSMALWDIPISSIYLLVILPLYPPFGPPHQIHRSIRVCAEY